MEFSPGFYEVIFRRSWGESGCRGLALLTNSTTFAGSSTTYIKLTDNYCGAMSGAIFMLFYITTTLYIWSINGGGSSEELIGYRKLTLINA